MLAAVLVALVVAPFASWGGSGSGEGAGRSLAGPILAASLTSPPVGPGTAVEVDQGLLTGVLGAVEAAADQARAAELARQAAAELARAAEVARREQARAAARAAVGVDASTPTELAASAPAPAPAPAPVPRYQSKGEQALALLSFPWTRLGYEVVFLPGVSGLRARVLRVERRIEVYVRPGDSVRQVAFDIAHEVGHAIDFEEMTKPERAEWQQVRAIDAAVPWYGCSGCTDYATPAGDWAEAFAVWQVGGTSRSQLAPQPSPDQLAVLARIAG